MYRDEEKAFFTVEVTVRRVQMVGMTETDLLREEEEGNEYFLIPEFRPCFFDSLNEGVLQMEDSQTAVKSTSALNLVFRSPPVASYFST